MGDELARRRSDLGIVINNTFHTVIHHNTIKALATYCGTQFFILKSVNAKRVAFAFKIVDGKVQLFSFRKGIVVPHFSAVRSFPARFMNHKGTVSELKSDDPMLPQMSQAVYLLKRAAAEKLNPKIKFSDDTRYIIGFKNDTKELKVYGGGLLSNYLQLATINQMVAARKHKSCDCLGPLTASYGSLQRQSNVIQASAEDLKRRDEDVPTGSAATTTPVMRSYTPTGASTPAGPVVPVQQDEVFTKTFLDDVFAEAAKDIETKSKRPQRGIG